MNQKVKLDLVTSNNLVMTPQLQQAIKLLQYSGDQLTEFLLKEIEKNPLLELSTDSQAEHAGAGNAAASQSTEHNNPHVLEGSKDVHGVTDGANTPAPSHQEQDAEQNFYQNDHSLKGSGSFNNDGDNDAIARVAGQESLQGHLMNQIDILFSKNSPDYKIALVFLGLLEETGWLASNWQQDLTSLGVTSAKVEEVLHKLQTLEPAGIFCRNLRECLMIQLRDKDLLSDNMQCLLDNLDCFISGDEKKLLERTGLTSDDIKPLITIIRAQDPKPGLAYQFQAPIAIEPDVVVFKNSLGEWQAELNSRASPRAILHEKNYQHYTQSRSLLKKDRQFIAEKFYAAKWLIKSLEQRQETILKVASKIIEKQKNFFDYGIENLKPLILRDIASAIEMHESTVSRVTTNKYMATPRGMFEMKFFFTQALEGSDKDNPVSAEVVRHYIKNIIAGETPDKILSDDVIVENLKEIGFQVARRTVAKYRESLSIPSSVMRRKMKNNFLYLG